MPSAMLNWLGDEIEGKFPEEVKAIRMFYFNKCQNRLQTKNYGGNSK